MAILFAASELESFKIPTTTNVAAVATTDTYPTDTARAGVEISNDNGIEIDFTGQTEGWLHFTMFHEDPFANNTADMVLFKDVANGDDGVFRWRPDSTNIDMDILTASTSTWGAVVGGPLNYSTDNYASNNFDWIDGIVPDDLLYTYDIHWVMHATTGVFDVYVNGVLGSTFSGDTLNAANVSIDQIRLSSGDTDATHAIFSEVIVATEDTRGMRVVTIDPDGAGGTNTAWTGAVTAIDEATGTIATVDSDSITSNTTGQIEQFTGSNLPSNGWDVLAFCVGFRGNDDASGVQQVRASLRTGAADFNGATQAMGTVLDGYFEVWETNPNTASAWTASEIDGIEFGVESIT